MELVLKTIQDSFHMRGLRRSSTFRKQPAKICREDTSTGVQPVTRHRQSD